MTTKNDDRFSVAYIDLALDSWYAFRDGLPEVDRLLVEGRQMLIDAGVVKE